MAAKVEKDKCAQIISQNLQLDENVVSRILVLLDNDNTIPFIARYRKEHSGGLDPAVLRHIDGQYQLLNNFSNYRFRFSMPGNTESLYYSADILLLGLQLLKVIEINLERRQQPLKTAPFARRSF
ncbi:uncharacterized protein HI_0568 isoform X2 [Nematostella vectensis]|uniref:uncharacterized protein HI_0568 isoform X2 n=1 Tax=Nematostella vectensis TaxID=45351 RepID=UPI0020779A0C|nr:uncharacterized protein HI_0568 isoform X2 [Nematostella vectensis]